MKIWLELDLEATHHEFDNGTVKVETVTFPGCSQNLLPFMSVTEQDQAQQAVEDAVEKALIDKALAIRDRKDMMADNRREYLADIAMEARAEHMASTNAQRGAKL